LYVQPTLEGVHRGLKVSSVPCFILIRHVLTFHPVFSFSIGV